MSNGHIKDGNFKSHGRQSCSISKTKKCGHHVCVAKSVCHEKDLTRCYEELDKSQFNVKSSYRKI